MLPTQPVPARTEPVAVPALEGFEDDGLGGEGGGECQRGEREDEADDAQEQGLFGWLRGASEWIARASVPSTRWRSQPHGRNRRTP